MAEEALDELNRVVLARLFWEDPAFLSSAVVSGKFALTMCIVNYNKTWDDVGRCWRPRSGSAGRR